MFDKIRWLHISDLHLKSQAAAWSQDVVLRALHKATAEQQVKRPVNFILATGDLSFSGKRDEFTQVEAFFDALLKELGLSRADVSFIPGNHDNDLSVQKYNVIGARAVLTSSGLADELVGDVIERNQILTRQGAFWEFVSKFVPGDSWRTTPDGLGYIATKTLSPLKLSIIGINSAWLCQSGQKDQGNVVVGERQIIEATRAIEEEQPHFVIAMIHHPLFWLCSFEHKAVEDKLRQVCDVVLRGHLHETDFQTHVTGDHRCVFAAAGASFKTRESRNSFNYVELDIGEGSCTITPFDYAPSRGEFSEMPSQTIALAFRHFPKPKASDIKTAILEVAPELSIIAAYLACLLRGDKSEFLAFDDGRAVFLSWDALEEDGTPGLRTSTKSFRSLRNLCTFAETQTDLCSTLKTYQSRLCDYGQRLLALAKGHSGVRDALADREKEATAYIPLETATGANYTLEILMELRGSGDLATLEQIARRSVDSPYPEVKREGLRGLAFVFARSSVSTERETAVTLLKDLCDGDRPEAGDFASLIQLLLDLNQVQEAKDRVRSAIRVFPEKIQGFVEVGLKLVQMTGDRAFRDELLQRPTSPGARS
jgi:predicted phosphodiesterase